MYATILVPLDGSPFSEKALPYAMRLAQAAGGRVVLIRSVDNPHTNTAEAALEATAGRLKWLGAPAVTGVYHAEVTEAIERATVDYQADLIVMATHGRSDVGRWFYGSVTDRVVRSADVPVLVVPGQCGREWPADRGHRFRLLIPLDGSEFSKEALGQAALLDELFRTEVLLVHVVEPINPLFGSGYSLAELNPDLRATAAQALLYRTAGPLRKDGRRVEVRTPIGDVGTTIAKVAREERSDLVIMATHGAGGLERAVMGSTAAAMTHLSPVPVLFVRPSALAGRCQARKAIAR